MSNDAVLQKLNEIDGRLDHLESNLTDFRQQTLSGQDETLTILRRLDEERVFTSAWVQRIENKVDQHEKDLAAIKTKLGIK